MPLNRHDAQSVLNTLLDCTDEAIITTDLESRITSWNPAAQRLFDFTAADAIGRTIPAVIGADPTEDEDSVVRRVRAGASLRETDVLRHRRDGTPLALMLTIVPLCSATGKVVGTLRIAHGLSDEDHERAAGTRLAAIVESSDDAIVGKDLNGIVTSWNRAAERMFGYSAEEMIGASIRTLIPADRQGEEDLVLSRIVRSEKVVHFETIRRRKDGTLIPISLTVSPILDSMGRVIGASKIARDISERKQAEAERARLLAISEQNAAITEKLNQVGSAVASALDRTTIVQVVTDAGTELTTAEFGAFFYTVIDSRGEPYTLYTVSGVPREMLSRFPMPGDTSVFDASVFDATFRGAGVVRSSDITVDSRSGHQAPFFGMPLGRLPVRSYLAVPVKSRSGEVLGELFFGHSAIGVFSEEHERLAVGIASWAAVALENARLYGQIQEASRLKDDFLGTLSHELRTPLNAILGYARMIRGGIVPRERQPKAIATIERNASSLTQIVEDVLDISRIISGKLRLNVQAVDFSQIVRDTVDGVMPAAHAKGIRVESGLDPQAGSVLGDPERLQQVVWNLLSNAMKFTERGGLVRVGFERDEFDILLTVSNTGVGISKEFLPHIFERFRQEDSSTTRERGGLGLGLGIARQLVEMHGGTIDAASEGPGTGARFRVRLPIMSSAPQAAAAQPSPARPAPPASASLRGLRVLVVDDDADALNMAREILEAAGGEVAVADSASAALEAIDALQPDVLVADIGMPRMDGFELIGRIRRSSQTAVREVPAAALTAYARSEDRAKALRCGFQAHLAKPIDPEELTAAVASLAGRSITRP